MSPRVFRLALVMLLGVFALFASGRVSQADDALVFVSSFAPGDQGAIQAYHWDLENGALRPTQRTAGIEHPFFLAVSPDDKFLYAIHATTFGGKDPEQVASFAILDRNGRLQPLNRQSTRGSASCYLEVDATGKSLLVANYSTGSVASLPIRADGSLGEAASFIQHAGSSVDPARQKGPYAHSIVTSPDNRFALAADLGLDQVLVYRLDATQAKLVPHQPPFARTPAGSGPRHLAFHPNGQRLYAINELKNSITVYDYASEAGTLTELQTISTLPADFEGTSYCADLKITPDGRFLYGTNRGHDSLATYAIGEQGKLSLIEIVPSLGKGPQNLLIAPNGRWLLCANMPGNNVARFRIDPATGKLTSLGEPLAQVSPSCIRLLSLPDSVASERAARQVVKQVVAAAGGEEKLLDLFRFRERVLITPNAAPPVAADEKGNRTSVVQVGGDWWIGNNKRDKDKVRVLCWAWSLRILLDPKSRVELLPESTVGDGPAIGVRVTESVKEPLDLWFDEVEKRLVAIDYMDSRHLFSSWKSTPQGHKYPSHVVGFRFANRAQRTLNEKQWYQSDILELTPLEEVPLDLKP